MKEIKNISKNRRSKHTHLALIPLCFLGLSILYFHAASAEYDDQSELFTLNKNIEGKGKEDRSAIAQVGDIYVRKNELRHFDIYYSGSQSDVGNPKQRQAKKLTIGPNKIDHLGYGLHKGKPKSAYKKKCAHIVNLENKNSERIYPSATEKIAEMESKAIKKSTRLPEQLKKVLYLKFSDDKIIIPNINPAVKGADLKVMQKSAKKPFDQDEWTAIDALPKIRKIWRIGQNKQGDVSLIAMPESRSWNKKYSWLWDKPFGEFISSSPVVVGKPPFFYPFDNYSDFVENTARESTVYIKSNLGSLHALRMADGVEIWGVIQGPLESYNNFDEKWEKSKNNSSFQKIGIYNKEESLQVGDIYADVGDGKKEWRTIVVYGTNRGQASYSAIDITSGKGFDDPAPSKLLWKFNHEKLGNRLSNPAIGRVAVKGSLNETSWGVFFNSSHSEKGSMKGNLLFGVSAERAEGFWSDTDGNKINNIEVSQKQCDRLSDALVVDLHGDYIADRIYVGNHYGDMFRIEKIGKYMTPKVSKLFSFNNKNYNANPISNKAAYSYGDESGDVWLYFGTGKIDLFEGKQESRQQYFIGLKDSLNAIPTMHLEDLISLHSNFKQTVKNDKNVMVRIVEGENSKKKPWKLILHAGVNTSTINLEGKEQVISKPHLEGGLVIFTTFIPAENNSDSNGETWIMALNYDTGLAAKMPVFDLNDDGRFNNEDMVEIDGKLVVPIGIKACHGFASSFTVQKDKLLIARIELNEVNTIAELIEKRINMRKMKVRLESWKNKKHRSGKRV